MTYGWAILVVLVAIGALAYFGVLSPEQFLPEKCTIASGSGMFCDDHSADATANTVTLRIHNILTDEITIAINSATITYDAGTTTCTGPAAALVINPDTKDDLVIPCALDDGDKVKGDIAIEYTKTGGLTKTASGALVTTAG